MDPLISVVFIVAFLGGIVLTLIVVQDDEPTYVPWVPPDGMARCGIRGCENPHPATEWVEDRDRD